MAWAEPLQAASVEKQGKEHPWAQLVLPKGSASACAWSITGEGKPQGQCPSCAGDPELDTALQDALSACWPRCPGCHWPEKGAGSWQGIHACSCIPHLGKQGWVPAAFGDESWETSVCPELGKSALPRALPPLRAGPRGTPGTRKAMKAFASCLKKRLMLIVRQSYHRGTKVPLLSESIHHEPQQQRVRVGPAGAALSSVPSTGNPPEAGASLSSSSTNRQLAELSRQAAAAGLALN